MDSFEWNKIAGAVLGTLIFILVIGFASEAIFEAPEPAKPGYVVEGVQEEASTTGGTAAPAEEALPDFGTVLPTADAAAGQKISARCEQCHDLSKGGPNKIGPNLWGVVGRARATHPGFSYSGAMSANHDPWRFDTLFKFLKSPAAFVPGTKMSFAGLRSAQDRINLLAWLRQQSDSPVAIPPPAPKSDNAQAPNGAAPATKAPAGTPATPEQPQKDAPLKK
ncbi:MAG: cytochrome c family protein [Alphaproteobacteria bacterium]|nr:cytochrome c family protein [Alphaproteobacteria bacterium]